MRIIVYGPGCARCKQTEDAVRQAVAQSGVDAEVDKVSDFASMAKAGVMTTPAVEIDGKIAIRGRVPAASEIVTLIMNAQAESE